MTYEKAKAKAIRVSHRRWAQIRARGRRRYIWVHGVFGVGVTIALGFCLGLFLAGRFHPVVALYLLAIGVVGGSLVGIARWKYNEEAYRAGRAEEIG